MKTILLPGGLGYIGSHTIVQILEQTPHRIVVVENFSNCFHDVVERILLALASNSHPKDSNETYKARITVYEGRSRII